MPQEKTTDTGYDFSLTPSQVDEALSSYTAPQPETHSLKMAKMFVGIGGFLCVMALIVFIKKCGWKRTGLGLASLAFWAVYWFWILGAYLALDEEYKLVIALFGSVLTLLISSAKLLYSKNFPVWTTYFLCVSALSVTVVASKFSASDNASFMTWPFVFIPITAYAILLQLGKPTPLQNASPESNPAVDSPGPLN